MRVRSRRRPAPDERAATAGVSARLGVSLVEVLVSLLLLGVGVSLSMRVLSMASRSLDEAELGLRALFVLSEIAGENDSAVAALAPTPAGPGRLVPEPDPIGAPAVRYEPPAGASGSDVNEPAGPGPFSRPHRWQIGGGGR